MRQSAPVCCRRFYFLLLSFVAVVVAVAAAVAAKRSLHVCISFSFGLRAFLALFLLDSDSKHPDFVNPEHGWMTQIRKYRANPPTNCTHATQVDNVFGKMKQRDAEDVLGDIAKQDRRISRARQSIAPAPVRLFFLSFFGLGF